MRTHLVLGLVACGVAACGDDAVAPVVDGSAAADVATPIDAGADVVVVPPTVKSCTGKNVVADAWVADPKMCVEKFAGGLGRVRQMAFAPNGDLFVHSAGAVVVLLDDDKDGASANAERSTFATAPGLNHGVAFSRDSKFLYASSDTTIYRWAYASGDRKATGAAEVVVKGIPGGGHDTRTLVFDSQGRLIVNVGSGSNVDATQNLWDTRGMVRRFAIPQTIPSGGLDYATGEVFASGLRNEVGLTVDGKDRVWGVENGRDDLFDSDNGGDIHNDNPGEEINFLSDGTTRFFGYPICWSEFKVATGGKGAGTQWADQSGAVPQPSMKTDPWCQDTKNVHPPAFVMQGHWAPLGITQYSGTSLPWAGDLIIASHGSWDRQPATGRVLARAKMNGDTVQSVEVVVAQKDSGGNASQGTWGYRLVDVQQGPDQAIYVSDDLGGNVFRVGYTP
ncbi:sorbosone dehydrogenase family protein [soil metagenome]